MLVYFFQFNCEWIADSCYRLLLHISLNPFLSPRESLLAILHILVLFLILRFSMAFIHEMRSLQASIDPPDMPLFPGAASGNNDSSNSSNNLHPKSHSSNATDMLMLSMAKQNFSTILNAVHKMEEYWAGVNYVATLLEKRKSMATRKRTAVNMQTSMELMDGCSYRIWFPKTWLQSLYKDVYFSPRQGTFETFHR